MIDAVTKRETRQKNGNARVDTLRRTYGDDFARGFVVI